MRRNVEVGLVVFGALLVTVCASVASAFDLTQGSGPSLTLALNDTSFGPGETIRVTAKLTPGTVSAPLDAYIVVQLPTGGYLSLQLGGGLVPGIVPIARGIVPFPYEGTLVAYTFGGAEPLGMYTWYTMLTRPGTLEFVGTLQQTPFTVTRLSPETTRVALSEALRNGDFESAVELLGDVLSDVVEALSATARTEVSQALDTCNVVESRAGYQLCVTPDERFRFMLVQDGRQTWRVIVW